MDLFLTKKHYSGSARFVSTGRIRKISITAIDLEDCKTQLLEMGYIEPFEISEDQPEPATENQMAYAHDLGLSFPADITKSDMSYLLSKTVDHDGNPNPQLLQYAANRNLLPSPYIGKRSLYDFLFSTLDGKDKVAFFLFCVYRYCTDDRYGDLDTHTHSQFFYDTAESLLSDSSFLSSMNKYEGNQLRFFGTLNIKESDGTIISTYGGSTQTIAYKRAVEVLRSKFTLPQKAAKTISSKRTSADRKKNKTTALLLCIFLGFFGIHKFYEGKNALGVIYLFTLGLFGIGWIVDIFTLFRKPIS